MPGEGSRGGVVIGHTRAGNPIYQDAKPESVAYRPFLPGDHASAALVHEKAAAAAGSNAALSLHHRNMASAHRVFYEKAVARSRKPEVLYTHSRGYKAESFARSRPVLGALMKAEGEHGGVVVGHTSSGKPIYQSAGASAYPHFKSFDHADASRMHSGLQAEALRNKLPATAAHHGNLRYEHVRAAMRAASA